jgi:TonB family protein
LSLSLILHALLLLFIATPQTSSRRDPQSIEVWLSVNGEPETGSPRAVRANSRDAETELPRVTGTREPKVLEPATGGEEALVQAGALGAGTQSNSGQLLAGADAPGEGALIGYEPPEPAEVIAPEYPPAARRRRQEGSVRLRVSLDALGLVRDVWVLESSGVSALDAAALEAASDALFRPARTNGESVASSLRLTVTFELETDSES